MSRYIYCHIYPFYEEHAINPLVHAPVRVHEEMKKQALETMSMQENEKSKMSEVVLCFMPIINSKYSQSNSIVLDYCTFILLLCLKKQNMINLVFVYISYLQLTGTTKIVYTELYCFIIMKLFQSKLKLIR